MTRPTIDNVWASGGTATDPGGAKVISGWAAEIPPFETQNYWQNRVDLLLEDIEKNGIMTWDALTTYGIGPWTTGSDGEIYKSITDVNLGNDPISSPVNWTPFSTVVAVQDATESVKGIVELSSLAETQAGTDDSRAVSPKNLKDSIQQIVPDASTSIKGKVELAGNTETQTGTDAVRAVTPAGLASVVATETRAGLVERATDAEAVTGTDTTRYISPKQFKDNVNTLVPDSSETVKGKIERATQTEVDTGTDDVRAITPKKLRFGVNFSFNNGTLGSKGFVIFPSWMGGFIMQWGTIVSGSSSNALVFPVVFPNQIMHFQAGDRASGTSNLHTVGCDEGTTTGGNIYTSNNTTNMKWFAIGH